jgi:cyclopropane fatty-acyl-phospholipid synthase-like methyltransferase
MSRPKSEFVTEFSYAVAMLTTVSRVQHFTADYLEALDERRDELQSRIVEIANRRVVELTNSYETTDIYRIIDRILGAS